MSIPNYVLDLDRSLPQTMREQARDAIIAAIRSERPGFCVGDHLTNQELSRQNGIHRNTLAYVIDDLVRLGFLRRLPNKGFEIVQLSPERPPLLTQHILSLSEIAKRDNIDSCSKLISAETGYRKGSDLVGDFARVNQDLALNPQDSVTVLARCRLTRMRNATGWNMVSIEQSFFPTALTPGLLENALQQIQDEGDVSIHRQLRRIFPNEDFFKAHYEISLFPLPPNLATCWTGTTSSLISVVSITYCSKGAVEMTRTWFDANQAVLTAGSLDVKLVDPNEAH
jgi:DNA-binding GntR family transcriptional regulator